MAGAGGGGKDKLQQFEDDEEIDSFFDDLLIESGLTPDPAPKAAAPAAKAAAPATPKSPRAGSPAAAKAPAAAAPAAPAAKAPAATAPAAAKAPAATSPAAATAPVATEPAAAKAAPAPAAAKADAVSPKAAVAAKAPADEAKAVAGPAAPAVPTSPAGAAGGGGYPATGAQPPAAPKAAAAPPATSASAAAPKEKEPEPVASTGHEIFQIDDKSVPIVTAPEAPPAPEAFSSEDLALREELADFYHRWNPDNLRNVNLIVEKYRGRGVSSLWAQLSLKYQIPPAEAVELLTRSLYASSLFQYVDEEQAVLLEQSLAELCKEVGADEGSQLLEAALAKGAEDGTDALLRALCFRGLPEDSGLRPQIWKVMLGYLPMAHRAEWNAIHAEKRALYLSYKGELLEPAKEGSGVEAKDDGKGEAALHEAQDLLQEIQNDVDRTRQDMPFFSKPETRATLLSLLFVYARLNPGVRYVQGMNEVAAVVLWVMSADPEAAEADAFWVFSELMVEIKEGFMEALDHTGEGVHALTEGVGRLLKSYDPDVARHLQDSELPPFVFIFRWCTVLFSQDLTMSDVTRLWDTFLSDPHRFEFVVYTCVALVLGRRDDLLGQKQFTLAEVLQAAPRSTSLHELVRRASAICAFERRRQAPPFPPKAKAVQGLDEWAQSAAQTAQEAAAMAQELGAEVSKTIQENIAPVVSEKASQVSKTFQENIAPVVSERASQVSAVARAAAAEGAHAAAEGAHAVQSWLQETAPARREAIEHAHKNISSLWDSVRSGTQRLTQEYAQGDAVESASARLSTAADSAAATASSIFARAAAALSSGQQEQQQQQPSTARAPASSSAARSAEGRSAPAGGGEAAPPALVPAREDAPEPSPSAATDAPPALVPVEATSLAAAAPANAGAEGSGQA